ncbi:hypothetical protein VPHD479_0112 [Vibrio phage D479]
MTALITLSLIAWFFINLMALCFATTVFEERKAKLWQLFVMVIGLPGTLTGIAVVIAAQIIIFTVTWVVEHTNIDLNKEIKW